jgi:hypothetical protein
MKFNDKLRFVLMNIESTILAMEGIYLQHKNSDVQLDLDTLKEQTSILYSEMRYVMDKYKIWEEL